MIRAPLTSLARGARYYSHGAVLATALPRATLMASLPQKNASPALMVARRSYATRIEDIDPESDAIVTDGASSARSVIPAEAPKAVDTIFPLPLAPNQTSTTSSSFDDWSKSFHGMSTEAFSKETAEILQAPLNPLDIEMKPGS